MASGPPFGGGKVSFRDRAEETDFPELRYVRSAVNPESTEKRVKVFKVLGREVSQQIVSE